jgi:hypothetical protein
MAMVGKWAGIFGADSEAPNKRAAAGDSNPRPHHYEACALLVSHYPSAAPPISTIHFAAPCNSRAICTADFRTVQLKPILPRFFWRATVDKDGHYVFAVPL